MAMAELSPRHKVVTGVRVFGPTGAAGPGPCIRHPPTPPPPGCVCMVPKSWSLMRNKAGDCAKTPTVLPFMAKEIVSPRWLHKMSIWDHVAVISGLVPILPTTGVASS